jgi:hypothetical protein
MKIANTCAWGKKCEKTAGKNSLPKAGACYAPDDHEA